MKGDFSRLTFDEKKNYSGVRKQQGRVTLDSDSNESADIVAHHRRTRTVDIVGAKGAPFHASGFKIFSTGGDSIEGILVSTGRMYVDGLLCELHPTGEIPVVVDPDDNNRIRVENLDIDGEPLEEGQWVVVTTRQTPAGIPAKIDSITGNDLTLSADVSSLRNGTAPRLRRLIRYNEQPDYKNPPAMTLEQGKTYLFYLDAWERHITMIEDPDIREKALGGPDTATRVKTVAQVKALVVEGDTGCHGAIQKLDDEFPPSGGRLTVTEKAAEGPARPCVLGDEGGYRGLENRLYRVEIHQGGDLGAATFKWSRDNGSVVYDIVEFIEDETDATKVHKLRLRQLGRDDLLKIKVGDRLEISADSNELHGEAGTMAEVDDVNEAERIVTLKQDVAGYESKGHAKARRWDQGAETVDVGPGPIDLEDGIQVSFSGDNFRTGDYWVFAARSSTGLVEDLTDESPRGIEHHYCPLALVERQSDGTVSVKDCRPEFAPLTEHINFFYLSGDGQEAMPGDELPQLLRVGVTNGQRPVAGARVKFRIVAGSGKLFHAAPWGTKQVVTTNQYGVAWCRYRLDDSKAAQRVVARLLDEEDRPVHLPIFFNVNPSIAERVRYYPGACGGLSGQTTVQSAIERLSEQVSLQYVSGSGLEVTPNESIRLVVRAASRCGPVQGMDVKFEASADGSNGDFETSELYTTTVTTVTTGADGLAECLWHPNGSKHLQEVSATFADDTDPLLSEPKKVVFQASLSLAKFVHYDQGLCDKADGATNVQDAIDNLCRAAGRGGCAVTVGTGGEYATLRDAFDALSKEGSIHICLLPGVHPLKEALPMERKESIKITGCGSEASGIELHGDVFFFTVGQLILQDLHVKVAEGAGALTFTCSDLSVERCLFRHSVASVTKPLPSVLIQPVGGGQCHAKLRDNRMTSTWIKVPRAEEKVGIYLNPHATVALSASLRNDLRALFDTNPFSSLRDYARRVTSVSEKLAALDPAVRTAWRNRLPAAKVNKLDLVRKKAVRYFYDKLPSPELTPRAAWTIINRVFRSFYRRSFNDSLALAKGVGGCLENNDISGGVTLHYVQGAQYLQWGSLAPAVRKLNQN